jgi:hypothetical protein
MDVHHRPNFDNPSTSYLYQDDDYKKQYADEEADYQYPPAPRAPLYQPAKASNPTYTDAPDLEETDFANSRQSVHLLPPKEKDQRSCMQRVSYLHWYTIVSLTDVEQYLPSSTACRLYLLVILLQTAVDLTIEADILIQFDKLPQSSLDPSNKGNVQVLPVYLGIFAVAQYVL